MAGPSWTMPMVALDAVVLDTETTGLDASTARIVQIGAIEVAAGRLSADALLDRLVDPGIPIPPSTTAVHGITDAMVKGAIDMTSALEELERVVGDRLVVGHTIAYDMTVIEKACRATGRPVPAWRTLDVRHLAEIAAPGHSDHGLDRLCSWLGIENRRRHSAFGDAEATARVLLALVPHLTARGIRTLAEAEAAIRKRAETEALRAGRGVPEPASQALADMGPLTRIDSFPYRHRVRDLMSAPAEMLPADSTVAAAVAHLMGRHISSVLVSLENGTMGIVTERDLLRAIDAGGAAALGAPIRDFARSPLQTVPADAFAYRAIGRIERLGFRHLGVTDGAGAVVGVVTTRNLLRHRATTAIALGDEIDAAPDAAAMAAAWSKVPMVVGTLLTEDVDPHDVCAVVSTEIRAMTRRAAELAEIQLETEGLGRPPVPYAVLVLGSGGRGESQLAADQDNAIVYAEGAADGDADRYFERLGVVLSETLDIAGIPLCKGGVMARNQAWRKSAADWITTIDGWVRRQRPEDLLNVDIFFDAVSVHGASELADRVWSHAYARGHASRAFLNLLTESARQRRNPFTLLGNLRVDAEGRADLKRIALMPIFTAARVLSIRHDVRKRSSAERLEGCAAVGAFEAEVAHRIIAGQSTLLGAVLRQQLADLAAGVPLTPRIAPARMSAADRAALKAAIRAADEAVALVSEGRI